MPSPDYTVSDFQTAEEELMRKQVLIEQQFVREIRAIPNEYLPNLLQIVRLYRDSVALKSATESFREGWRDALRGDTTPVSELWDGIDAE
jgi:hypothetical protein